MHSEDVTKTCIFVTGISWFIGFSLNGIGLFGILVQLIITPIIFGSLLAISYSRDEAIAKGEKQRYLPTLGGIWILVLILATPLHLTYGLFGAPFLDLTLCGISAMMMKGLCLLAEKTGLFTHAVIMHVADGVSKARASKMHPELNPVVIPKELERFDSGNNGEFVQVNPRR